VCVWNHDISYANVSCGAYSSHRHTWAYACFPMHSYHSISYNSVKFIIHPNTMVNIMAREHLFDYTDYNSKMCPLGKQRHLLVKDVFFRLLSATCYLAIIALITYLVSCLDVLMLNMCQLLLFMGLA
jgi:hypothetical protein